MFKKVLIANRGEIACRIIKTLKLLNIVAVAIYSEADKAAMHVKMADEAYQVGEGSIASDTYLNVEKILEIIHKVGVDAVHPGYGFLSENAEFCKILMDNNIVFIGPHYNAIEKMGDKIISKKIAEEAAVNVVPGYMGEVNGYKHAEEIAVGIGFPVMIKAAAGGGGKGMKIVYNLSEIREAFESATNEAIKSFKDGRVFMERYVNKPRHIEIQVLADKHGNVVCLGERECSIQRNHQKVIEEAPSVFLDDDLRKEMYEQCKSLVREVNYYSVGTVEFIMNDDKEFFFLEMNTRLQVEHPVTELITGLDLVEEMVRVAADKELRITQDDVVMKGWAIESRIYAEDPSCGFLPSIGVITKYYQPEESNHIRIDTGIQEGSEVSMYYDPMIAKLCTYGKDRKEAIKHMRYALGQSLLLGLKTNIQFLESIFQHDDFVAGDINTGFIYNNYQNGVSKSPMKEYEKKEIIALMLLIKMIINEGDNKIFVRKDNTLLSHDDSIEKIVDLGIMQYRTKVWYNEDRKSLYFIYDNKEVVCSTDWQEGGLFLYANVDGQEVYAKIIGRGKTIEYSGYTINGDVFDTEVWDLLQYIPKSNKNEENKALVSPIAGLVVKILVTEGEEIKAGTMLCKIEAMKMENPLYAKFDSKVTKICCKNGDIVDTGDVLIQFE